MARARASSVVSSFVLCSWLVLVARSIGAQGDAPRFRVFSDAPPDARLGKAVTLDGYHAWEPPATLEAWKARREVLRRQVLVAAGLWPMPEKAPIDATIHGRIDREGYTVEKVIFASWPGHYVTGNLYRPKGGPARKPAVLSPHGHWNDGRLCERSVAEAEREIAGGGERDIPNARYHMQARCAGLARLGCVVFHFDMIGYADSRALEHRSGFGDVDAELRLQSWFGLQTWNTIRAYDFLAGLPDVDASRIGVTGASGGGTQTFVLLAIDDRPAAGFPAVMVSTDMQGGCVCENASHLRVGTTNVEFAALAAPRPYGMTAADDWTREMATKGFPELERLFALHGKKSKVALFANTEFGHNYNRVSREHMYGFFNEHLKLGHDVPIREQPCEPIAPKDLSVFDDAHLQPADVAGVEELRAAWTRRLEAESAALWPEDAAGVERFRDVIGGAFAALAHTDLPAAGGVEAREIEKRDVDIGRVRKLALSRAGAGEAVPAIEIVPANWNGSVVVIIDDDGKRGIARRSGELRGNARALLAAGAAIVVADVFLTGEYVSEGDRVADSAHAAFGKDADRHGGFVGYTYGYNRTLIAQRVHDALTVIGYARSIEGAKRVRLTGSGEHGAVWAIYARAIAGSAVDRAIFSAISPVEIGTITALNDADFLPGAAKYGGTAALLALSAPHETMIARPSSSVLYERVRAVFRAAGAGDALRVYERSDPDAARAAVIPWLVAP